MVLLRDLFVLVVPHDHGDGRTNDITHYLRRLTVAELLRWLNIPKRQPLCEIKQDGDGTGFFLLYSEYSWQTIKYRSEHQKENKKK